MNDQEINAAVALLRVAKCPECDGSGVKCIGLHPVEYVSRDMARDAGDLTLEGSVYRQEEPEWAQCQWCAERLALLQAHGVSTKEI